MYMTCDWCLACSVTRFSIAVFSSLTMWRLYVPKKQKRKMSNRRCHVVSGWLVSTTNTTETKEQRHGKKKIKQKRDHSVYSYVRGREREKEPARVKSFRVWLWIFGWYLVWDMDAGRNCAHFTSVCFHLEWLMMARLFCLFFLFLSYYCSLKMSLEKTGHSRGVAGAPIKKVTGCSEYNKKKMILLNSLF